MVKQPDDKPIKALVIGIERHRLTTDGEGVTTLVGFHGCSLHCKYCLNPQCLDEDRLLRVVTPKELVEELMIDHLYFLATGGGVTFGGGEPLLYSDFMASCARLMPKEWKITIETALNVPLQRLQTVVPFVDHFIIDIKDMSPIVYKAYTGRDNKQVRDNLSWLVSKAKKKKITIRIPHIPNFNTRADIERSKMELTAMGFTHFDEFEYVIKNQK